MGVFCVAGKALERVRRKYRAWLREGEEISYPNHFFVQLGVCAALFLVLVLRLFYLSYKMQDKFGSLIIAGVASMFLFHIFENIGMTIGLMPVTGIPLPFMSYGGSSMLANLAAVGLVLNVVRHQQKTVL